jgi:xanthine dehydrogenase/oxidase
MAAKDGNVSMADVENSFGGNICRCTGYRPILDAFKSLASDADESLIAACKDIEDLGKVCPKTGATCAGSCNALKRELHLTFDDGKEWHKVFNVNDIFYIFDRVGDRPYMLVAGNTGHGVYRRRPDLEIFIDITGIEEIRAHSVSYNLELGGGVTITEAMEIFKGISSRPGFEYTADILKHFELVGNVPVRNIGSIAGNLMLKNQHKEFPSDLVTVFAAVGVKVVIREYPNLH